ncbi:hypothetical protein L873DRAFT_1823479, partial [Choiromyces venosus 120613-1]
MLTPPNHHPSLEKKPPPSQSFPDSIIPPTITPFLFSFPSKVKNDTPAYFRHNSHDNDQVTAAELSLSSTPPPPPPPPPQHIHYTVKTGIIGPRARRPEPPSSSLFKGEEKHSGKKRKKNSPSALTQL